MKDRFPMPKGIVHFKVYKDDILVDEQTIFNLITTTGRQAIMALMDGTVNGGGTIDKAINKIAMGTNGTATASTDTGITYPGGNSTLINLGTPTNPTTLTKQWPFNFGTTIGNGLSIVEFGLICADGTLFSRVTRSAIAKTSAISIVGTWTIDFS